MTYLIVGGVTWIVVGGISYWWHEVRMPKKNPCVWAARHQGLIALTDKKRRWMHVLWPFVVVAAIVLFLMIIIFGDK